MGGNLHWSIVLGLIIWAIIVRYTSGRKYRKNADKIMKLIDRLEKKL